jgi:hypothetical protein
LITSIASHSDLEIRVELSYLNIVQFFPPRQAEFLGVVLTTICVKPWAGAMGFDACKR